MVEIYSKILGHELDQERRVLLARGGQADRLSRIIIVESCGRLIVEVERGRLVSLMAEDVG